MKFIYFLIGVAFVFFLIITLIVSIVNSINEKPSISEDIDKDVISSDDSGSFTKGFERLIQRIKDYFDKELIHPKEASKKIRANYFDYIIDVRTKEEWNKGHYPSAIHIPIQDVEVFKNEVSYYYRELKFLVYCRTGKRAKKATDIMKTMGFKNLRYLSSKYNRLELPNKNELMNPK